jgi:hypothetical protein
LSRRPHGPRGLERSLSPRRPQNCLLRMPSGPSSGPPSGSRGCAVDARNWWGRNEVVGGKRKKPVVPDGILT